MIDTKEHTSVLIKLSDLLMRMDTCDRLMQIDPKYYFDKKVKLNNEYVEMVGSLHSKIKPYLCQ